MAVFLAFAGLSMGSFIDALTWRLKQQEESDVNNHESSKKTKTKDSKIESRKSKYSIVSGRSMCEKCEHVLEVRDLVPVLSWLSTKGRCRYCKGKIGWQVPLIEVFMASIFMVLYWYFPLELSGAENVTLFVLWLMYAVGLVAAAVYDLRWLILPNRIILPLVTIAILAVFMQAVVFGGGADHVKDSIVGMLIGGGLFYALFQLSNGRWIGGGDVKLGFFMGLALGALKAAIALWLAFAIAFVVIVPLLLLKIITRKDPVPFGPFLILSTLTTWLWGQDLAQWYDRVFLGDAFF